MVRVNLDVLVRNPLFVERDPCALHKGAEPSAVEFQGVVCGVGGGVVCRATRRVWFEGFVDCVGHSGNGGDSSGGG